MQRSESWREVPHFSVVLVSLTAELEICCKAFLNQFCHVCILGPPGYLIGYVSHHKPDVELLNCEDGAKLETKNQTESTPTDVAPVPEAEVQLYWKDITQLLKQKLTSEAFSKTLQYVPHVHTCKTTLMSS